MIKIICILILLFLTSSKLAISQDKSIIDSVAVKNWPSVRFPSLSADGNYVCYFIDNEPVNAQTCVVRSAKTSWERRFIAPQGQNERKYFFGADNKHFVLLSVDTVYSVILGTDSIQATPNITSCKWATEDPVEWFAYQNKQSSTLFLVSVTTGKKHEYKNVSDYRFGRTGASLTIVDSTYKMDSVSINLRLINNISAHPGCKIIWSSPFLPKTSAPAYKFSDYSFNTEDNQLLFCVSATGNANHKKAWYFKQGMDTAVILFSADSIQVNGTDFKYTWGLRLGSKSNKVFFNLAKIEDNEAISTPSKVEIWSKKDWLAGMREPESKFFLFTLDRHFQPRQITHEFEQVIAEHTDFVLTLERKQPWDRLQKARLFIVSLTDSSRKMIHEGCIASVELSPSGKFVVFYDIVKKQYYCHNVITGVQRNISGSISTRITSDDFYTPILQLPVGFAGWCKGDSACVIYDNFDLWKIDLLNFNQPKCITKGVGKVKGIKFRIIENQTDETGYLQSDVILSAFNVINKYNGFYKANLEKVLAPRLLTMGKYDYYHFESQVGSLNNFISPFLPIKAKNHDTWIVQRMSTADAPNFYITTNFSSFSPITSIQPQSGFNWLTAELISWRNNETGKMETGVLYKPENFDPTRKYPVIFSLYEKTSFRLYQYPVPAFSDGSLNISWFVNNGYLVFTPDISYETGAAGESARKTIMSAVNTLCKRKYVDSTKLGIHGHSFGGFETNYIITHSNVFSAAAESAGVSNFISSYGTLRFKRNAHFFYESVQFRMGKNLWQAPKIYLDNSPIFLANKVSTPLLMLHNKQDDNIAWQQGLEFFMALQKFGKKVWMLQYDKGYHTLNQQDARDYTIRLTQFYDYYLKNGIFPQWMND